MKDNIKKPASLFKKTPMGLPRSEFRSTLRKSYDPRVNLNAKERIGMEKEFSYQKYGSGISEKDVSGRIKELKKEGYRAKHTEEKLKIDRKIKLLEKLKGM
jgi:hypothetical protein